MLFIPTNTPGRAVSCSANSLKQKKTKHKEQHQAHRPNRENHRALNRWLKKRSVKWTEIHREQQREKGREQKFTSVSKKSRVATSAARGTAAIAPSAANLGFIRSDGFTKQ